MDTISKQKQQQNEIHSKLWNMANDLRGSMDASEFKSYILGLIFYRYLSEKVEKCAAELLADDATDYKTAWKNDEMKEALQSNIVQSLGYIISPRHLFSNLIDLIKLNEFDIEELEKSISAVSESSLGADSQDDFENLFDDMDLKSSKLGKDVKSKSKVMSKIMNSVASIDFEFDNTEIDVLGDAYEYLIGMFAQTAGKKAGEFYTPQQVSKILAKAVTLGKTELKDVYDPCCGSGSLLLRIGKECKVAKYYGQESNATTFNLARMNMLLHGKTYQEFSIANDDTLKTPHFYGQEFEAVVANPPYSAKWSADIKYLDEERFSAYGRLAPASKADFAFVQHMVYHLSNSGTMAVVLPHGVLFRGAAEAEIRKVLIKDKNWLDTVIGLPANLFYGTSIPTCILIFKKDRTTEDILFIDASKEFSKEKAQNYLSDIHVDKIVSTFASRAEIEKYSHLANRSEIEENDYNLNIPRYVDTFEEEPEIDIKAVQSEIKELEAKRAELDIEIEKYLKELGL